MSNPFVLAVMKAFRGKLPKSETDEAKDARAEKQAPAPSPPTPQRKD